MASKLDSVHKTWIGNLFISNGGYILDCTTYERLEICRVIFMEVMEWGDNFVSGFTPWNLPWTRSVLKNNKKIHQCIFIYSHSIVLCAKFQMQLRNTWCHGMELFSAFLALCEGNPLVTCSFPLHRANKVDLFVFSLLLISISCWSNNRVASYFKCHDIHMV